METLFSSDGIPALTVLVGSFGSDGRDRLKCSVSNVRSMMNSFWVINLGQQDDSCKTRSELRAVEDKNV